MWAFKKGFAHFEAFNLEILVIDFVGSLIFNPHVGVC